eukprot:8295940-Alexandrium_andersonii.AAC.1
MGKRKQKGKTPPMGKAKAKAQAKPKGCAVKAKPAANIPEGWRFAVKRRLAGGSAGTTYKLWHHASGVA